MATEPAELAAQLGISKTVYSLVWPETRAAVKDAWWSAAMFDDVAELYEDADTKKQDTMHQPFLDCWRSWTSEIVTLNPALLTHQYPTNGSSEAIRDAIDEIAVRAHRTPIVVFQGEYEGYRAIADARGVAVVEINRDNWRHEIAALSRMHPTFEFFLSQPSAIDGMLWREYDDFMQHLWQHHPSSRIYLDLCYVGCVAEPYQINATHAHIEKVFFSLSKVFGVYYHRIGGVYSRRPMPGLYGNMWFKNLFSLNLGIHLMSTLGAYDVPQKYRTTQLAVVAKLREAIAPDLVPSDVVLLAHRRLPREGTELDRFLARGKVVRYCLMPTMKQFVRPHEQNLDGPEVPAGQSEPDGGVAPQS